MKKTIVIRILPYLLVLIGTFFLGFFILVLKSPSHSTKTKYDFVRSLYPSDFIVQKTSPFDSLNIGKNTLFSFDSYILLKDNSTADRDLCTLMNENGEKLENIVIPERSMEVVSYIDSCLFWISNFKLKAINVQEKIPQAIFYENKIINAIAIDGDKFLTVDMDTIDSNCISFSICTKTPNSLKRIGNLEIELSDKYKTFQEKALAYSGVFHRAFNHITYSFSHIPYIYVFNDKRIFITAIKTKDNVPYPSVIQYKDYFILERGESFNSNIASFVYKDILCVFSYHAPSYGEFTVDCYNLSDGMYKGSISIKNEENMDNRMIDEVVITSKYILINSRGRVTTFQCLPRQ